MLKHKDRDWKTALSAHALDKENELLDADTEVHGPCNMMRFREN